MIIIKNSEVDRTNTFDRCMYIKAAEASGFRHFLEDVYMGWYSLYKVTIHKGGRGVSFIVRNNVKDTEDEFGTLAEARAYVAEKLKASAA